MFKAYKRPDPVDPTFTGEVIIRDMGTFRYKSGQLHAEGVPAEERTDGTVFFYKEGRLHNERGPAIIYGNGVKHFFVEGRYAPCLGA
jgi:hypothetical protein